MNVLNYLRGQCPKPTDVGPWYGVYHEVHEDHEGFHNLISICVLRALRGDMLFRCNLLSICKNVLNRVIFIFRSRLPRHQAAGVAFREGGIVEA